MPAKGANSLEQTDLTLRGLVAKLVLARIHAYAYQDSEQWNAQMAPWLHHYNWHRPMVVSTTLHRSAALGQNTTGT